ncbi:hypothetical protein CPG37_06980 [Malaciobacter canalis]|uniref:Uncharacterized protein n=1 Tax=Malaciobacter canalis TaxID=1912871 RepID=A0ABX4LPC2_9BACT|nr:hypothetical protein [Malaciobacter canalis]PHO09754.1 hypothetical protein CPG37_06980 [Malaciobacter canalis]QEE33369.1 hypothetical protein ACAN_1905 [Malaciobacter canalis]
MNSNMIEEFERIQKELTKTHENYMKAITPTLSLYISNYHFKKGEPISKHEETKTIVNEELNDILDYMNGLFEHSQRCFDFAKLIHNKKREEK